MPSLTIKKRKIATLKNKKPHWFVAFFLICFFFCLDAKETKNQGQPEWLRPFVRPAPRGSLRGQHEA